MAKVYVVDHYRHERTLGWRGKLCNLLGGNFNSVIVSHRVWQVFDTEEKAKNFIRFMVGEDHKMNVYRRKEGLDAHDCELNEEDLVEFGYVDSYWYDEKGIRTTVWYKYYSRNVA